MAQRLSLRPKAKFAVQHPRVRSERCSAGVPPIICTNASSPRWSEAVTRMDDGRPGVARSGQEAEVSAGCAWRIPDRLEVRTKASGGVRSGIFFRRSLFFRMGDWEDCALATSPVCRCVRLPGSDAGSAGRHRNEVAAKNLTG